MTKEQFWKNFNLGTELQVSGNFIYNSLQTFDEMESFHYEEEVFEFLYNISVGLERLIKIVIVLTTHDKKTIDQKAFEEKIKNHKHSKLIGMVQKHHKLNLDRPHFAFLQLLEDFYQNMRYDRFNLDNVREYDKEKKHLEYFLTKYLDVQISSRESLFMTNRNSIKTKKRMGKLIGKISTQLYDIVRQESRRLNIYTYEIRYPSKAYKVFMRKEFDFTSEHNYWKEMLIYLMNNDTKHELKDIIQDTKPLEFDEGMIPEYITNFKSHLKKLHSLEEMEFQYGELEEDLKNRQELLNFISSDYDMSESLESSKKDNFEDIIDIKEAKKRNEYFDYSDYTCDFCRKILKDDKYIIDGQTKQNLWAWMCEDCFEENGVGIEWGFGQLYQKMGVTKWLLVAGYDKSEDNIY